MSKALLVSKKKKKRRSLVIFLGLGSGLKLLRTNGFLKEVEPQHVLKIVGRIPFTEEQLILDKLQGCNCVSNLSRKHSGDNIKAACSWFHRGCSFKYCQIWLKITMNVHHWHVEHCLSGGGVICCILNSVYIPPTVQTHCACVGLSAVLSSSVHCYIPVWNVHFPCNC